MCISRLRSGGTAGSFGPRRRRAPHVDLAPAPEAGCLTGSIGAKSLGSLPRSPDLDRKGLHDLLAALKLRRDMELPSAGHRERVGVGDVTAVALPT